MAAGVIYPSEHVPFAGLSERMTNMSAVGHTPFKYHIDDVGYVADISVFRRVFLYNGTGSSASVADIIYSQTSGINVVGVSEGMIIPAMTSALIDIEVTRYGPPIFAAVFVFVFSCSIQESLTLNGTRPIYATDQPMPITLDQAIAEAYAEPGDDTFYDTLEFSDSVSGDKILVVHSDEELETPQGTFIPCKFGCKHPETEGGVVGVMQITVDFLPLSAQLWILETCRSRGKVTVYWRQYLGPNQEPDAHYPIPLDVTSVEQTALGATINASFPMLTAMKFPRRLMTTTILPGARV
jgi:hypothetical protein